MQFLQFFAPVATAVLLVFLLLRFFAPDILRTVLEKNIQKHKAELDRNLEEFKIRTQSEVAAKLEIMRSSMARDALEHQVRFTKLYERRAEVVAGIYKRLEGVRRELSGLSSSVYVFAAYKEMIGINSDEKEEHEENHLVRTEKLLKSRNKLDKYFDQHAIWLEADTEEAVEDVLKALMIAHIDAASSENIDPDKASEASKDLAVAMESVDTVLALLRQHFREILSGRTTFSSTESSMASN